MRALYHINLGFRGVYLTYFMFEEVFYKNTSTSKISSDHFSRFLHKLYLIIYARYLSKVFIQDKYLGTFSKHEMNRLKYEIITYKFSHIMMFLIKLSPSIPCNEEHDNKHNYHNKSNCSSNINKNIVVVLLALILLRRSR